MDLHRRYTPFFNKSGVENGVVSCNIWGSAFVIRVYICVCIFSSVDEEVVVEGTNIWVKVQCE